MEGYYGHVSSAQSVSWEVFLELEAERTEKEFPSNGKSREPEKRDVSEFRSLLHNRPGR